MALVPYLHRAAFFRRHPIVPLALALVMAAPASSFAQPVTAASDQRSIQAEYLIGPEDVLDIVVWDNPLISRTIPVRPDGKISLPLLNDVVAGGLTPMQLRDDLAKGLARYIPNVEVSVIVREVHSFKVAVIGEVKTPGRYELKALTTVLDVLALAGGLNEYADRGRILVLRREGPHTRQIPVDYDKLTSRNGSNGSNGSTNGRQENFLVRPADIILVP